MASNESFKHTDLQMAHLQSEDHMELKGIYYKIYLITFLYLFVRQ